jgi:hypothetical protein
MESRMRRGRLRERRRRTVKENPEFSVPVEIMKPEVRRTAIVVGNLSTETRAIGAESDRDSLIT